MNATADAVTSPEIEKFLFEANAVAVEALPVNAPTNVVEVRTPELKCQHFRCLDRYVFADFGHL